MKTASWIVLALAATATLLASLNSLATAYRSDRGDQIGPLSLAQLSAGKPEVEIALRSRRATAAAYGAGFATLFLAITAFPYRRGEVWAWWALLAGMLVVFVAILLRVPFLGVPISGSGTPTGGGTVVGALIQLAVISLGLALGAGRLRQR